MHTDPSHTPKGRRMLAVIQEHRKNGGLITDFCRARHLSPAIFHWWKRRLRDSLSVLAEPEPTRFVHVQPQIPAFIPFVGGGRLELSFPDGRALRMPADYSPADLVTVLRGSACS